MTLSTTSAVELLTDAVVGGRPVSVFCGAGISCASPSNAPLWSEIRDGLLAALLKHTASQSLVSERLAHSTIRELKGLETRNDLWIKPELVLHWMHARFGNRLFDALKVFDRGIFNRNHQFLARLAATFPQVRLATCNFDMYLERALAAIGMSPTVFASDRPHNQSKSFREYCFLKLPSRTGNRPLLKIHGSLAELATIRATLTQVSKPMRPGAALAMRNFLCGRTVLVIGYSGNDLDLLPIILQNLKSAKLVIWIEHPRKSVRTELSSGGRPVLILKCDLNDFLLRLNASVFRTRTVDSARSKSRKQRIDLRELDSWAKKSDANDAAVALGLLGMSVGLYSVSDAACKGVLRTSKEGDPNRVRALMLLGITNKRRDPEACRSYLDDAERECHRIRNKYPSLYGNIIGNKAALEIEQDMYQPALRLLRISTRWARRAGLQTVVAQNCDDQGSALREQGHAARAIIYHRRAEKILRQAGDLVPLARVLNNLGTALADLGQLDAAERCMNESLDLKRQETSDAPALGRGLLGLAELKMQQGKPLEAISLLKDARSIAGEMRDEVSQARILFDLAEAYRFRGLLTTGLRYLRRAEITAKAIEHWDRNPSRRKWINRIRRNFQRSGK